MSFKNDRIYFDYAAATPLDPRVEEALLPFMRERFGNPGSLHSFGQEAIAAVDRARETVAKAIGADFREVIFTGSATEANNLALRGAVKAARFPKPRIIISAIEHESVLDTAKDLECEGVEVIYIPVSKEGFVNVEELKKSLNERTVLISVMHANNVIGTIQPLSEISKIVKDFRERKSEILNPKSETNSKSKKLKPKTVSNLAKEYPLLHTDAAQTIQYLDCNVNKLGVDLMSLSAHKICGPKGVGGLYIRRQTNLTPNTYNLKPITTGGNHEFGLRAGTPNVPAIVGFARAVELISASPEAESNRIQKLGSYFWRTLEKAVSGVEINGGESRVPSIYNVYFPGVSTKEFLIKLDMAGIAVSIGSACSSRSAKTSHVIEALGYSGERLNTNIRFSFGRFTTKEEINEAVQRLRYLTQQERNVK